MLILKTTKKIVCCKLAWALKKCRDKYSLERRNLIMSSLNTVIRSDMSLFVDQICLISSVSDIVQLSVPGHGWRVRYEWFMCFTEYARSGQWYHTMHISRPTIIALWPLKRGIQPKLAKPPQSTRQLREGAPQIANKTRAISKLFSDGC